MPSADTSFLGHTVAWGVLIPGVLLPTAFFLLMGGYPFVEQWATGDRRPHTVLDRPRNMPARTGAGAAIVTMAAVIQLAGADDVISYRFGFSIFPVVWSSGCPSSCCRCWRSR
jgi:ubiquinol-cytochrome c reductase cytochrome b subunit